MTTDRSALRFGPAGDGGYRHLHTGPGEPRVVRSDLTAAPPADGPVETLLTVAHLSDLHVCDHQSPARIEFLDRWADPDSPVAEFLGEVGTYRAQEMLSTHVVDACVRSLNDVLRGPVFGREVDLAVATGDNTDNSQSNEVDWYLALLDGGRVHPDSGDITRYEGVADDVIPDDRYWRPESAPTGPASLRLRIPLCPRTARRRAPSVRRCRADRPLAGRPRQSRPDAAGDGARQRGAGGGGRRRPQAVRPSTGDDASGGARAVGRSRGCDPDALASLALLPTRPVTADPGRHVITRKEFVDRHDAFGVAPPGHGFSGGDDAYYRHDVGRVTLLVLDTVDEYGGWQGSLDRPQFDWLTKQLVAADREQRYVVLASHHPLDTLVNDAGPDRVLGPELQALLTAHRSVVLWLAGHTHAVTVTPGETYWEVVAPSLIDWPQQARIVELVRGGGILRIAATMVDHAGQAPWSGGIDSVVELAGLSRELAANDWQWRTHDQHPRIGAADQRNVLLSLPDPSPDPHPPTPSPDPSPTPPPPGTASRRDGPIGTAARRANQGLVQGRAVVRRGVGLC